MEMDFRYYKIPEEYNEHDLTEVVGQSLLEDNLKFKIMENGLFKLSWVNVKSALTYGFLSIVVAFVLSVVESILQAGSIFGLNWHHIIDSGVIQSLTVFVVILSLLKNLLTTNKGNFVGLVKVVPPAQD